MKYFVQYAIYNNERIDFDKNSRPILGKGRAIPNFSGIGENQVEKMYLDKMKAEGFNENSSQSVKWLRSIFPEVNVKQEKVRGLAEFFAFKLGTRLGREIYRRRASLLYWMQEKLGDIADLLSANTMTVCCDNKLYNMVPPQQPQLTTQSQTQQTAHLHSQQQPTLQMNAQTMANPQNGFPIFDSFDNVVDDKADLTEFANYFDEPFAFDDMLSF